MQSPNSTNPLWSAGRPQRSHLCIYIELIISSHLPAPTILGMSIVLMLLIDLSVLNILAASSAVKACNYNVAPSVVF